MKIILVLFLYSILSISESEQLENGSEESTISNVPERKRLPLFKHNIKYTVKLHETDKLGIQNSKEDIETRKPMVKIIPRTKKVVETTEIVTRKPLMKVKSYTVKMRSLKKETVDEIHKQDTIRKLPRSFEIDDKSDMKKYMSQMNKLDGDHLKKLSRNIISASLLKNMEKTGEFSEEDQDRNEFIFLEKNKSLMDNDLLYESEEDFEMTTTESGKLRRIRSSNIIEEENMGTTISPLKYTGHDSRLSNNLYFKNINH